MSAITGFGNHIVFAIIHCTKKVSDFIFVMVMFFFCLCSGNRIDQSMHHFPDHFLT